MYRYIKGIVSEQGSNYIVIDNNGIGYMIYVSNPLIYKVNDEYTVYTYMRVTENDLQLYGFLSIDEYEFFKQLIRVKGVGERLALPLTNTDSIKSVKNAILEGNVEYLKEFPKIGEKVATQIIIDLRGKINTVTLDNHELINALNGLGYRSNEIKGIVDKIDYNLDIKAQIVEALKLLRK